MPDSEKMGCVRWGVDWRKRAVYKKNSASTLRVVQMLCVFIFVLNFLSATDPPSARQKAARRNGGPVGESNLEVFAGRQFLRTVLGRVSGFLLRNVMTCAHEAGHAK